MYGFLANLVMLTHLAFVLFVIGGGLLVLKWPRIAWLHVPAAVWGTMIEFMGWTCPLTPLENRLLAQSAEAGYEGDFITHYLLPVLYPEGLTPTVQIVLGLLVVLLNAATYGLVFAKWRQTCEAGS
ncbi:MAG: DUF2784 domain-containing protein [Nitrospiraceae bacterium]